MADPADNGVLGGVNARGSHTAAWYRPPSIRTIATGVVLGACGVIVAAGLTATVLSGEQEERRDRIERRLARLSLAGTHIGASVRDTDAADVTRAKLPGLAGAVVEEVRRDSPASNGGLRAGDVIVEFDGERVRSARQLERLVDETPAGREIAVALMRDGERITTRVTPERGVSPTIQALTGRYLEPLERLGREFRFDVSPGVAGAWPAIPELDVEVRARPGLLGVGVTELSEQLSEYFGVADGVLVTTVREGSPAAQAGLKAGDVITAIDGVPVEDAGDLRRAVAEMERSAQVSMALVRDRKPLSLTVTLGEPTERSEDRPSGRIPL